MNVSIREKRILKLVHPRFIETHSKPVKAAEILKKYPRYSITRPDVFQFPWIVIKPEATLVPGKVFYLVPHRTMYKLLKAARERNPDQLYQSPYRDRHSGALQPPGGTETEDEMYLSLGDTPDSYTNQTQSPLRSSAGSTPKHFGHGKNNKRHAQIMDSNHSSQDELLKEINPNCSINGNRAREGSISGKIKSCLAKENSNRKFMKLVVTFGSPIFIPASPEQSPSSRDWPDQSPNKKYDGYTNGTDSAHHTFSKLLTKSREGHQDHALPEQYPSPSKKGFSSTLKHLLRLDSGEVSGHSPDDKHGYYNTKTYSPTMASAGNTPKHSGRIKNHKIRMINSPEDIAQHAHIGSSQNQVNWCPPDYLLSENRPSSSRNPRWNEEIAGVSRNGGQQIRSCIRKPNSYRKFLNLEVTFMSPIHIVTSPGMSPGAKGSPGGHQIFDDFYHQF
ncbi:hypothetical protein LIER_20240 [Lithospermum erythrorhizon]|uniref:Uncharacterized protein n=1 Tax=Lithospermum erythrorhizon TaxID=34254 RepID=A0AAV3QNA3_LITER